MFAALGYSTRELRENRFRQSAALAGRLLTLSLAVFLFLPGCSWIFVKPAKVDGYRNPECSTSRAAPVIDTILAVNDVGGIVLYSVMDDVANRNAKIFGGIIGTILFTSSAYYGYSNTSRCIENKPEGWDQPDPDERARVKKKPSVPLRPEPGVMRSN